MKKKLNQNNMPQPFQNLQMNDLLNMTADQMFKKMEMKPNPTPLEIQNATKIAELAHFLVNNFRDKLSPEEHCVDTAIKLLSHVPVEGDDGWISVNEAQRFAEWVDGGCYYMVDKYHWRVSGDEVGSKQYTTEELYKKFKSI